MSTRLVPMPAIVRPARPADRSFVVVLSEEAFERYARNAARNALNMMRGGAGVLIAENAETKRRLGFVIVRVTPLGRAFGPWENPSVGHVDAIAVDADVHRQGVGRVLLAGAEDFARERGAVSMSLMTADGNFRARALFASAGYQPILPVANAYIFGQSAFTLTKPLTR